MIIIKNLHNEKPTNPWDVVVDRTSVLGNPFPMIREYNRNEVCDQYYNLFYKRLYIFEHKNIPMGLERSISDFTAELNRLNELLITHGQLNLFCWCAPKRCHAETIKDYLFKRNRGLLYCTKYTQFSDVGIGSCLKWFNASAAG